MQRFVDLTLNGIANGAIYAAVALSLVLIWRATRILNFAQAGMLMLTTFIAWTVIDAGAPYWLGFLRRAGVGSGARARSSSACVIRPIEGAPPLNAIIVTLGLLVLLQAFAGMVWGGNPRSFPPAFSIKGFKVCGHTVLFSPFDLFTVLVVGGADGRARRAVPAHRPRPADAGRGVRAGGLAAARRARRADVHGRAGRWRRWRGRWPACSSRPRCSSRRPTSTPCSSSASPPRSWAGWRARRARWSAASLLGLALSYVSGYAGAEMVTLGALVILVAALMVRPERAVRARGDAACLACCATC